MARIYESLTELTGNTPLLKLNRYMEREKCFGNLLAKLEYFNPLSSVKDRVGLSLIEDAEKRGLLVKGGTIIEPTSGNTGIGLAYVAACRGYRLVLTMPESMSVERRKLLKMLGAQIVLTPASAGMRGAVEEAQRLNREITGSYLPMQFDNPANSDAHYRTTAPELVRDADGKIDAFVAGVGTGGTLTGCARYFAEQKIGAKIFAVEPYDSQVLAGKPAGGHKLQGIGANFVPKVLDRSKIDEIVPAKSEDAYAACRSVAECEGLLVGISSGAALSVAAGLAKRPDYAGKNIVVILPDGGERYLSTELFQ